VSFAFQNAVITFILRVFPSIEKYPPPTFVSYMSSPATLISLLVAVDTHIYKYADFTLQRSLIFFLLASVSYQSTVRMAAIYQLLHDNKPVAMLFSLLTTHAVSQSQSSSTQIDSSFSWLYLVGGPPRLSSMTQHANPQQSEITDLTSSALRSAIVNDFTPPLASPALCSYPQDPSQELSDLHPSISEDTIISRGRPYRIFQYLIALPIIRRLLRKFQSKVFH
jgi:hypothetical protein